MRDVVDAVGVGVPHQLIVLVLRGRKVFARVSLRAAVDVLERPLHALGQIDVI